MPFDMSIRSEDAGKFHKAVQGIARELPRKIAQAMAKSLDLIGDIATTKYMIMTGGGQGSTLRSVHPTKLTWRTRRLALSLKGQSRGQAAMTREGVRIIRQQGKRWVGTIGTTVPYAARHEFGGTFPITKRQIGFFFAKAKSAPFGEGSMWKALAIKGLMGGTIRTPRRPFLEPAGRDPQTQRGIVRILNEDIQQMITTETEKQGLRPGV